MPLIDYWPFTVVGATGAVGYGELRARVASVGRTADAAAPRELVSAQYTDIIRRLDRIEDRVNRVDHREGD